jgi:hypothetical protein
MPPAEAQAGVGNQRTERTSTASGPVVQIPTLGTSSDVDVPGHEDMVRKRLAYGLLILLAGIVVIGFSVLVIGALLGWKSETFGSTIQVFFTSVLTLVSTVIGFYFGSEHRRPKHHTNEEF